MLYCQRDGVWRSLWARHFGGFNRESVLAVCCSVKVFTPGRGEGQCLQKGFLSLRILSLRVGEREGPVRRMRNLPDRVEGGCRVYWTVTVSVVLPVIEPLAPVMVKV